MINFTKIFKLIFLLLILIQNQQTTSSSFPTTIWVYVQTNIQQLNIFRKINLQNIAKLLQNSPYQLKIISPDTYIKFLQGKTNQKQQSQRLKSLTSIEYLNKKLITKLYIKLTILEEYGGIWLQANAVLVQNFQWLDTLKNQKYINNRINQPDVVLFYRPTWFQETHHKIKDKIQELVVYPQHYSWFMAAQPKSNFIQKLKTIFMNIVRSSQTNPDKIIDTYKLNPFEYLLDQQLFQSWLYRAVVAVKQAQLDHQYGTKQPKRQLAVQYYKITSIDASKSALIISQQSNYHTHLTLKYLTQLSKNSLNLQFRYLIFLQRNIQLEILDSLYISYPIIEHLHSSAVMACDDQTIIPFNFIVKESVFYQYVLKVAGRYGVKVYDEEYVRHHCTATFLDVYYQFFITYLLPTILVCLHIYVVRRAILIFKPQWGIRKQKRYN